MLPSPQGPPAVFRPQGGLLQGLIPEGPLNLEGVFEDPSIPRMNRVVVSVQEAPEQSVMMSPGIEPGAAMEWGVPQQEPQGPGLPHGQNLAQQSEQGSAVGVGTGEGRGISVMAEAELRGHAHGGGQHEPQGQLALAAQGHPHGQDVQGQGMVVSQQRDGCMARAAAAGPVGPNTTSKSRGAPPPKAMPVKVQGP